MRPRKGNPQVKMAYNNPIRRLFPAIHPLVSYILLRFLRVSKSAPERGPEVCFLKGLVRLDSHCLCCLGLELAGGNDHLFPHSLLLCLSPSSNSEAPEKQAHEDPIIDSVAIRCDAFAPAARYRPAAFLRHEFVGSWSCS